MLAPWVGGYLLWHSIRKDITRLLLKQVCHMSVCALQTVYDKETAVLTNRDIAG